MNLKRPTTRHNITKLSKPKENGIILKPREKQLVTYKGNPPPSFTRLLDFSVDILQTRRESHDIFQVLKEKNLTKNTWQGYHSEVKERESFPDEQKLKLFITTRPSLQEMLKEPIYSGWGAGEEVLYVCGGLISNSKHESVDLIVKVSI